MLDDKDVMPEKTRGFEMMHSKEAKMIRNFKDVKGIGSYLYGFTSRPFDSEAEEFIRLIWEISDIQKIVTPGEGNRKWDERLIEYPTKDPQIYFSITEKRPKSSTGWESSERTLELTKVEPRAVKEWQKPFQQLRASTPLQSAKA